MIDFTMKQQLRHDNDTAIPFLYANYMIREGLGKELFEHSSLLQYTILTENIMENEKELMKLQQKNIPFIVLNDELHKSYNDIEKIENQLNSILDDLYPTKTSIEM